MRCVIGTMTGTSMDGIDAVATSIEGHGLEMKVAFLQMATEPIDDLQQQLRHLAVDITWNTDLDGASLRVGEKTLAAIVQLGISDIDLIALHGQTIFHKPPKSLQLMDPSPIVDKFDCTILTDPRTADLQLGGQGAPITPLADWIMFRDESCDTAVVNLGGFCNITMLPKNCQPSDITGFDLCCCNLLLDAITRERLDLPFDQNGELALKGEVHDSLFCKLKNKLQKQHELQRSLGTNDDLSAWILDFGRDVQTNDLLATVTNCIGSYIQSVTANTDRILIAGGGVHNESLLRAIGNNAQKTDVFGVPTQAREGMAMAILGALANDGVSITLPQITGRQTTSDVVGWIQASP
jgi:anhydro-N-acetylmuramic acid kinase